MPLSFTVEISNEDTFRLCYGDPEAEEWEVAGEVVDLGERALVEVDGVVWFAIVDEDQTFDGFAYQIGGSSATCSVEDDCEFEDDSESDLTEDDDSDEGETE